MSGTIENEILRDCSSHEFFVQLLKLQLILSSPANKNTSERFSTWFIQDFLRKAPSVVCCQFIESAGVGSPLQAKDMEMNECISRNQEVSHSNLYFISYLLLTLYIPSLYSNLRRLLWPSVDSGWGWDKDVSYPISCCSVFHNLCKSKDQ